MNNKQKLRYLESFLYKVEREFTDIYIAAAEAVKKRRVRKYLLYKGNKKKVFWSVLGREGKEYLITEWMHNENIIYACSCPDYLFRAMLKTGAKVLVRRNFCYHIVSRIISEINELKKELKLEFNKSALPVTIELKNVSLQEFLKKFV